MRPILRGHADRLAVLEKECSAAIRETLSGTLPLADLDRLGEAIRAAGKKEIDLSDLAAGMEDAVGGGKVDAGRLGALVEGARDLASLRLRLLGKGEGGGERATHGLVIAAASVARWAAVYPYNPFAVPAVVDTTGHAAPLAEGLVLGEIRAVAEAVALERRCRQLLADGGKTAGDDGAPPWDDWTGEEKALCPPLLLLFDDETLERHGSAHLSRLLHSDLPIKIVLLSRLDPGGRGRGSEVSPDAGLVALAHRGCFTLQSSIAHADHLAHGVAHALAFPGPAFIRIHAPSPLEDGFAPDGAVEQARLAVWSRAFPLFRRDPCAAGEQGRELALEGNPSTGDAWALDRSGRPVTYAHWAVTEKRFAHHFRPLPKDAPKPIPLEEYVEATDSDRQGRTPFILAGEDGKETRLEVSEPIAEASREHLRIWNLLRDLAGLTSDAAAAAHSEEIAALGRRHEEEVAAAREQAKRELTARIQSRLRAFAGVTGPAGDGKGM